MLTCSGVVLSRDGAREVDPVERDGHPETPRVCQWPACPDPGTSPSCLLKKTIPHPAHERALLPLIARSRQGADMGEPPKDQPPKIQFQVKPCSLLHRSHLIVQHRP